MLTDAQMSRLSGSSGSSTPRGWLDRLREVIMKRWLALSAGLGLIWSVMTVAVMAKQGGDPVDLKVGDPAPAFTLPGTDGKMHSLADYRGTTVVLAWFPKAFTGG
jgi:hypothetical protein